MRGTGFFKCIISAFITAALTSMLAGCVQKASTDEDILNDAGTSSGAAIVLDPSEAGNSSSFS